MNSKSEIAVFVSSGIGDAIVLVPMMRLLKNKGHKVSVILTSPYITPEFLKFNHFPVDEVIDLRNKSLLIFGLINKNRFLESFLDYSNSSVKNLIFASILSKKVLAYRKGKIFIPKVKLIPIKTVLHAALLNVKMVDESITANDFSLSWMKLSIKDASPEFISKIKNNGSKIISVQISSGNNQAPYKNWIIEHWIVFFQNILKKYSGIVIVLLGDENEINQGQKISESINSPRMISSIGQTSLTEAGSILYHSDMYIGLDSAFMHLAVAYDLPTFTIFGASSEKFIGYNQFDSQKHFVVSKSLSCRPCHAWTGANTTKVTNPNNCPDFECLTTLSPEEVTEKFVRFVNKLSLFY